MISLDSCYQRYGSIQTTPAGGLVWRAALEWLAPLHLPDGINLTCLGKKISKIMCNKDMHGPLARAFELAIVAGVAHELKTFDGAFCVRFVRGRAGIPSFHCWAVAIDFNAALNPLGGESSWSDVLLDCFHVAGFDNGGSFSRKDFMHFQLSAIP